MWSAVSEPWVIVWLVDRYEGCGVAIEATLHVLGEIAVLLIFDPFHHVLFCTNYISKHAVNHPLHVICSIEHKILFKGPQVLPYQQVNIRHMH
jgi:hypothetical protein